MKSRLWRSDESGFLVGLSAIVLAVIVGILMLMPKLPKEEDRQLLRKTFKQLPALVEARRNAMEAMREATELAREEGYEPGDPEWNKVYSKALEDTFEEREVKETFEEAIEPIYEDNE